MQKSDSIAELTKALVRVQSRLQGAKMDSTNPFFKAKYADLSSVWDACRTPLTDNGLAVIQTSAVGENHQLIIETILTHTSGEWISGQLPMLLAKNDPQGIGSAITYGRRYGLSAIVGICPEDDDGEGATNRKPSVTKPKPTLDKEWLKESLAKAKKVNPKVWENANLVPYLKTLGATGTTISSMVESLKPKDKEKLVADLKLLTT